MKKTVVAAILAVIVFVGAASAEVIVRYTIFNISSATLKFGFLEKNAELVKNSTLLHTEFEKFDIVFWFCGI